MSNWSPRYLVLMSVTVAAGLILLSIVVGTTIDSLVYHTTGSSNLGLSERMFY